MKTIRNKGLQWYIATMTTLSVPVASWTLKTVVSHDSQLAVINHVLGITPHLSAATSQPTLLSLSELTLDRKLSVKTN